MRKHETSILKYALVFGFTMIVFLFGMLLGNYFTQQKIENINMIEENLQLQTQGAELQYLLVLEQPCKYINSTPLTNELYSISEKLDYMESQRGESDPDVLRLKNTYSLLQLRHWIFTLKTNKECKLNNVPIMFFYSNTGDCPSCKEQGYTLTYLRRKYPDLRVYAFDISTDNPAMETIRSIHKINTTPMLVFPDRTLGFTTLEELEEILNQYNLTIDPQYA
jgi:hypothetical protein